MIHLSQELVFFKAPGYLERLVSFYEKHNGKGVAGRPKKGENGVGKKMQR
jgi:hypothetical protein